MSDGINTRKLRALLVEHNINQKEFAEEVLGISKVNFNRKLNKHRKLKLIEAKKAAEFFGVSIEELFFSPEVTIMDIKKSS